MEEIIKKIRKHLESLNNNKFINYLFIILVVSIILLIGANFLLEDKKVVQKEIVKENIVEDDYSSYLERKLEVILGKLKGVGEISVMVTLEDTSEKVPAINTTKTLETTKELDSEGGTREVNREDTTTQMVSKSNDGSLVLIKEVKPNVKGVIVVAEGADDAIIMEKLYEAVKTVLGISGNRVQVYSSK